MSGNILKIVSDTSAESPDLRSVSRCLRNLADNIDDGEFGECVRAAVVLRCAGREPIVCGQGDTNAAQTFMDLHAGAQELLHMHSPERIG